MTNGFVSPPDGDLKQFVFTDNVFLLEQSIGSQLFTYGDNQSGQLGDNTVVRKSSPIQTVTGGVNWQQMACSGFLTVGATAGVKTDGTLWNWGLNTNGNLGDNTTVSKSSPVQTVTFASNWKQVSISRHLSAAIKKDGTLWTWGIGTSGQLGDSTAVSKSSPVQTVAFNTNWMQVSAGYYHIAAVKTDGTLWSWGLNANGQLGDGTTVNKSSPVQTVTFDTTWQQVSCGYRFTVATKTDGTLWTWGRNGRGVLGDGTTVAKSSPVQTAAYGNNWRKTIDCQSNFSYSSGGIKTDGTLWMWGRNAYGELADNTTVDKSSPIQTISGGTSWKMVAGGYRQISALKIDGTIWNWGNNAYGQLGDNTTVSKSSPIQTVVGGTNWRQTSCGWQHNIATTNGNVS